MGEKLFFRGHVICNMQIARHQHIAVKLTKTVKNRALSFQNQLKSFSIVQIKNYFHRGFVVLNVAFESALLINSWSTTSLPLSSTLRASLNQVLTHAARAAAEQLNNE